jgi:hypothetical protein
MKELVPNHTVRSVEKERKGFLHGAKWAGTLICVASGCNRDPSSEDSI